MAEPENLTLYVDAFWSSPFDFTCFVALTEKGLSFSTVRAIIREGAGLPTQYRDRTITGRVPALVHGEFWLAESQAVAEYLEDVFRAPAYARLLPAHPQARARSRQVMGFLRADLIALRRERPSQRIFYPAKLPPLSAEAAEDARLLVEIAERLLYATDFAGWSIARSDLAFALLRLARTGYPLPPAIVTFLDEECARPSVRAYLEHARPPHAPE